MTLTEAFAIRRQAKAGVVVDPKVLKEAHQVIAVRSPQVVKAIAQEVIAKVGRR